MRLTSTFVFLALVAIHSTSAAPTPFRPTESISARDVENLVARDTPAMPRPVPPFFPPPPGMYPPTVMPGGSPAAFPLVSPPVFPPPQAGHPFPLSVTPPRSPVSPFISPQSPHLHAAFAASQTLGAYPGTTPPPPFGSPRPPTPGYPAYPHWPYPNGGHHGYASLYQHHRTYDSYGPYRVYGLYHPPGLGGGPGAHHSDLGKLLHVQHKELDALHRLRDENQRLLLHNALLAHDAHHPHPHALSKHEQEELAKKKKKHDEELKKEADKKHQKELHDKKEKERKEKEHKDHDAKKHKEEEEKKHKKEEEEKKHKAEQEKKHKEEEEKKHKAEQEKKHKDDAHKKHDDDKKHKDAEHKKHEEEQRKKHEEEQRKKHEEEERKKHDAALHAVQHPHPPNTPPLMTPPPYTMSPVGAPFYGAYPGVPPQPNMFLAQSPPAGFGAYPPSMPPPPNVDPRFAAAYPHPPPMHLYRGLGYQHEKMGGIPPTIPGH